MTGRAAALRRVTASPGLVAVALLTMLFLAVFVLLPLFEAARTPGVDTWRTVLASSRWRSATLNTLWLSALSVCSAVLLGLIYALAVARFRIPGWRFFGWVPLAGLFSPPFVGALALILLFGRNGLITRGLLGLEVSIYGWHGVWFAQTLAFFPLAYLVLVGVLQRVPSSLEQAAAGYGAGSLAVLRSVTLPLARPGILAAGLFVGLSVLSDFGTPMLLGGRFRVLATEAYTRVSGWGDLQGGAALGLVLLVPALLLYFLQVRASAGDRYATVGSRARFDEPLPASPLLRWTLFAICTFVALMLVLKLGAVVLGAFANIWGVDLSPSLRHFSWVGARSADLLNTMKLAPLAAVLCTAVALLAGFLVHGVRVKGRTLLDLSTLLPAAIPGTLLGIAYVLAFNDGPLRLTGTGLLIVICMAIGSLPTAYRIVAAALVQMRRSLFESASDLGAGWLRVFTDMVVPLLRGPSASSLMLVFIHSLGTLSAVIFLVSPGSSLASVSILNLAEEGYWGGAAALATVLMFTGAAVLLIARLVLGRSFRPFGQL